MATTKPYSARQIRNREQQRAMCDLYRAGETLQQIGDRYGITRERVRQIVTAAGVSKLDGGVHKQAIDRAQTKRTATRAAKDARYLMSYGCDYATVKQLNGGERTTARFSPANGYRFQRRNAALRGIPWAITFPQWMQVWAESGHHAERGRGRSKYCMARHGDTGPYAVGNVYITTCANNVADYQATLKKRGVVCADGWKRLPEHAKRRARVMRVSQQDQHVA